MTGILSRIPFAMGVIKSPLAVAPHIFAGQGVVLSWKNGLCSGCSGLMTVAFLAPVSIMAQGSPTLSRESRVMSGGGMMSRCDLLWATTVLLELESRGGVEAFAGWTSAELTKPTNIFVVTLIALRLMRKSSSGSNLESELQVANAVAMESVVAGVCNFLMNRFLMDLNGMKAVGRGTNGQSRD